MKTYAERTRQVRESMKKLRSKRRRNAIVCTGLAAVMLALVLFVPYSTDPPSVRQYASSPYYDLIQKINLATYERPAYKNNFEALTDALGNSMKLEAAAPGDMPNYSGAATNDTATGGNYVEVTDNQVAGVTEADLIKRSDKYIYYLRQNALSVYTIDGDASRLAGAHTVAGFSADDKQIAYDSYCEFHAAELYLSPNCTTVTVVIDAYNMTVGSCTILVNLDVTNPANIRETGRIFVTGNYNSSRLVDGKLLLISNFRIGAHPEFSDESDFLPQVGTPGNMESVAAEDIFAPDTLTSTRYSVICMLDAETLQILDTTAFLSYSDELYVSRDAIYATRTFAQKEKNGPDHYTSSAMTEITGISYSSDSLELLGSVSLEGTVKDQYSMDQYEDHLRVVTSTSVSEMVQSRYGEMLSVSGTGKRNVNLYCVGLDTWTVEASVIGFAPEGETAESVRFSGDTAYICTAQVITLTDPVYFFDLSDLSNITWKDTGTIDGYSSSLVDLGDGHLLGIGYGDARQLKVEIYEETADGVKSVCSYIRDADFSEEYKAYLIDREKDLVGLLVADWNTGTTQYILLRFDGYKLREILDIPFDGHWDTTRAVLNDGHLYLLGDAFQVEKLW